MDDSGIYDKGGIEFVCKNKFKVQQRFLEENESLVDLPLSMLQPPLWPMVFSLHCFFPNTHTHTHNCKIPEGRRCVILRTEHLVGGCSVRNFALISI